MINNPPKKKRMLPAPCAPPLATPPSTLTTSVMSQSEMGEEASLAAAAAAAAAAAPQYRLLQAAHALEGVAAQFACTLSLHPDAVPALAGEMEATVRDLEKCQARIVYLRERAKDMLAARGPESTTLLLIRTNIKQAKADAEELYALLPSLRGHILNVELLLNGAFSTDEDRRRVCLELRLGFEDMLNSLLTHYHCPTVEGMPLGDRVLFLKPHLLPPVRLNCFFDIKEYSSLGVHKPVLGHDAVSLRSVEKMIVAFRSVVEETRTALRTPALKQPTPEIYPHSANIDVTSPQRRVVSPVAGVGKYKTVLCRNWKKYGSCPHADRCLFAHGEDELRAAIAAASNNDGMPERPH